MNIRVCASMSVKIREQLLTISSLLPPLLMEAGFLLLFLLCCGVYSRLTGLLASGKFSCLCCLFPHNSAGIADVSHHPALFFFLSSLRFYVTCFLHIYLLSPNSPQIHCCFLPTQLCVHLKKPFKIKIKYSWMCGLPIDHGWLTKGYTSRQNGFSISQLFYE